MNERNKLIVFLFQFCGSISLFLSFILSFPVYESICLFLSFIFSFPVQWKFDHHKKSKKKRRTEHVCTQDTIARLTAHCPSHKNPGHKTLMRDVDADVRVTR